MTQLNKHSTFSLLFKEKIIANLYIKPDVQLKREMCTLVQDNCAKQHLHLRKPFDISYVYIGGIKYYSDLIPDPMFNQFKHIQTDVHPDMYEMFNSKITEIDNLAVEKNMVGAYLRNIINSSKNIGDIVFLTIPELHTFSNIDINRSLYRTLTDKDIAEFKLDNAKYETIVKERLIINLLHKE